MLFRYRRLEKISQAARWFDQQNSGASILYDAIGSPLAFDNAAYEVITPIERVV